MALFARGDLATVKWAASFCVVHVAVLAPVAYAVTGSLLVAFALSLLEPTVQTVAFVLQEMAGQGWSSCGAQAAHLTQT